MWKAGQDPTLRMTVGIVLVLDRAPSYDSLVERFAAVIKCSPRLQSRPGDQSLTHACPSWVEDDAPDAEHHLRSAAVSRPGSLRQLLDLVGLLESVPFDPDRAPWDGTLIEGLEGDRAALYLRAHHVVTDGLAGLRLAGRFLDGDEIDLREKDEIDLREEAPPSGRRSGIDDRSDEGTPSVAGRGERGTRTRRRSVSSFAASRGRSTSRPPFPDRW